MSIALSALLITMLLLPGGILIQSYTTGLRSREAVRAVPIQELLIKGLILSILMHALAVSVLLACGFSIRFELLYKLVLGEKSADLKSNDSELTYNFLQFSLYSLSIVIVCFITSKLCRRIVSRFNLDLTYPILAMANPWFIFFSGRYLETPGVLGENSNADVIFVEVLTDYKVIYSGILQDFTFSPAKDALETVVLREVRKKDFRIKHTDFYSDETQFDSEDGRQIPCDMLLINASKIVNVAITYLNLSGPDFNDIDNEVSEGGGQDVNEMI